MFEKLKEKLTEKIASDFSKKVRECGYISYDSDEGTKIINDAVNKLNGKPPIVAFVTSWAHNSGIALGTIKDGKAFIICNNEQERFGNREKYTSEFPYDAIKSALDDFCIDGSQNIDLICSTWNPSYKSIYCLTKNFFDYFPSSIRLLNKKATPPGMYNLNEAAKVTESLKESLKLSKTPKLICFDHHLNHASAFYFSPFEEALVWVCDGYGDTQAISVWHGKGKSLKLIQEYPFLNSLGLLYSVTTYHCGFWPLSGEGKLMGLSAYGDPDEYYEAFKKIVDFSPEKGIIFDFSLANWQRSGLIKPFTNKFLRMIGPPVKQGTPFYFDPMDETTKRRANIAAALQKRTQEIAFSMISYFMERENQTNIVMAGGFSLNCPTNQLVSQQKNWNVYIPPNPSDSGTDFAGTVGVLINYFGAERPAPLETAYFCGKEYSPEEIEYEIKNSGLNYIKKDSMEEIYQFTTEAILNNLIVAWFQGRAETGPRALGNRSILANPSNPDIRDIINSKVKLREIYRPLCPSILEEFFPIWFHSGNVKKSPFMTTTFRIKDEYKDKVKAVVHKDGTCRVQTVSIKQNLHFYNLIRCIYEKTKIPMILNTSFNINEPIVQSPFDALKTFKNSSMDYLIIGSFIVNH